ncbi:hypothetical protein R3P38DRAFT_769414 [Favolaschia claudopus]|uniref:Uncharacterized protein n=1 Tax=Favolaschia claudopus TaxID=2862362 RepID=A0AAW0C0J1_9AGAR
MKNIFVKLLPRWPSLSRKPSLRCTGEALPEQATANGVLDISKEARDAIAAEEQEDKLPFAITFYRQSPMSFQCIGPYNPVGEEQAVTRTCTPSPASSSTPSMLPSQITTPPNSEFLVLRDVPASTLGRRRNFKGRRLDTIPIPPMPTAPAPAAPPRTSSSTHSLRRQPRYTNLNGASPRRTPPFSRDRRPLTWCPSSEVQPGSPTAPAPLSARECSTTFAGDSSRRPTFTHRASAPLRLPDSATLDMFSTDEILFGPQCIPGSPSTIEPVLEDIFTSLDDVYAQYHEADEASLVSISLSDSGYEVGEEEGEEEVEDDDFEDLDGEVAWRVTYSLADEYASWLPQSLVSPLPSSSDEMRPCPYSFLAERTQTLSKYLAVGSRSLPDFALEGRVTLV